MGTNWGQNLAILQQISISEKDKLIPLEGVYAVKTDIDEHFFEGMMYIGKRPTVTNQPDINIEINIFDFNQNIYDKFITIQILKFYDRISNLKIWKN